MNSMMFKIALCLAFVCLAASQNLESRRLRRRYLSRFRPSISRISERRRHGAPFRFDGERTQRISDIARRRSRLSQRDRELNNMELRLELDRLTGRGRGLGRIGRTGVAELGFSRADLLRDSVVTRESHSGVNGGGLDRLQHPIRRGDQRRNDILSGSKIISPLENGQLRRTRGGDTFLNGLLAAETMGEAAFLLQDFGPSSGGTGIANGNIDGALVRADFAGLLDVPDSVWLSRLAGQPDMDPLYRAHMLGQVI